MFVRFLIPILTIFLMAGCANMSPKPVVQYETKIVNVPVPVLVDAPKVDKFESRVLQLTDASEDGEVGKAYKQDWLSLMLRDKLFTDFLIKYEETKRNVQAATPKQSD